MPINRIKGEGDDLVDVEELITTSDNLDGKKALVTNAVLNARAGSISTYPLRAIVPVDASTNSYYLLGVVSHQLLFNNTDWDKWRNNTEGTIKVSAARTTTYSSNLQTNYNHKGIYVILNVTAKTGAPSITMKLEVKNPITAGYSAFTATSAAITTTGTYILALHPALVDTAGVFHLACDALLPRSWRLYVSHANADSITYSVSYALMV